MKWQAARTILRDILSMALGAFIAVNEELSGHVHAELITFAAVLITGPTGIALYHTIRKNTVEDGKPETQNTVDSSL